MEDKLNIKKAHIKLKEDYKNSLSENERLVSVNIWEF